VQLGQVARRSRVASRGTRGLPMVTCGCGLENHRGETTAGWMCLLRRSENQIDNVPRQCPENRRDNISAISHRKRLGAAHGSRPLNSKVKTWRLPGPAHCRPLTRLSGPPFQIGRSAARTAGPENKYFEGPLSRRSRECRCEIIVGTHRTARQRQRERRAGPRRGRGGGGGRVPGNLVVFG